MKVKAECTARSRRRFHAKRCALRNQLTNHIQAEVVQRSLGRNNVSISIDDQNALRLAAKALDIGDGQDVDQPGKAEQPTSEQPAKAETDADDSDDSDSGGQSKDEGRDESDQDESGDMDTEQPDLEGTDTNADEGALTPDQEAALAGALTDYLSAIQEVLGNE